MSPTFYVREEWSRKQWNSLIKPHWETGTFPVRRTRNSWGACSNSLKLQSSVYSLWFVDKDQDVFASTAVMCTLKLGWNRNKYPKGTNEENNKKGSEQRKICSHIYDSQTITYRYRIMFKRLWRTVSIIVLVFTGKMILFLSILP